MFRVQVFGRKPTIAEILGPDFLKGPSMAGAMTHQEFLDLVTPTDVQGYAAFDNKQGMMVAATSFALQWALRQAIAEALGRQNRAAEGGGAQGSGRRAGRAQESPPRRWTP